jgi:acyl-CoA synthetase (AMP-forming)/AMP-acid ligase II
VVATGAITAEEVTAFCRQHLAVYKTPEHVVFVDDLPYSDTGKVVRRRLVELIQERSTRPSAGSR